MGKKDERIDEYIADTPPFAKPILKHLRSLVHKGCPGVEETIKWGAPHFDYKGIMAGMASFKNHCSIWFWKASLLPDPEKILVVAKRRSQGSLGPLTKQSDLPSDKVLLQYIKAAARINEEGIKATRGLRMLDRKALVVPAFFKKSLQQSPEAKDVFEGMSYTQKKDYLDWFREAKTGETRDRRVATALEWLAEGKSRNWKYEKK